MRRQDNIAPDGGEMAPGLIATGSRDAKPLGTSRKAGGGSGTLLQMSGEELTNRIVVTVEALIAAAILIGLLITSV